MTHALLLADWTEVIGSLVVIVFVVLRYLITELSGGAEKAKPAAKPRPAPQPAPAGPQQGDLRSEVDEFLRRAKGLPPREPEPRPEPERPPQRLAPAAQSAADDARDGESDPYGQTIDEHVSQHLGHLAESQLAEQAAHLGEQVGLADDKLEARLKAKFEHRLGKLKRREEEPPPAVDPLANVLGADQVAAMLANPEGVRNAVVISEILNRPTDRW